MSDLVQLTRDGEIAIITIQNPPVNALSTGVPQGISEAIGQVGDDVLFVVYTDRGETRHIISARLASRKERRSWRSFAERWKASGG